MNRPNEMEAFVPDENTPFGNTEQQRTYGHFLRAVLEGDRDAALACINPDEFGAYIPGRTRLRFDEYTNLVADLRSIAPDFGQDVRVMSTVENDHMLVVLYRMRYQLVDMGKAEGNRVEFVATDWVTFDNAGKIIEIRVLYDRFNAQEQAFGRPLKPVNPND